MSLDTWEVRIQAEELLAWGAGKDRPTSRTSITSLPDANQALQVWRDWWNKNHRHVDLKARLSEPRRPRLIFFIEEGESSVATGRVWLAGSDGSQRWGLTGLARPVMVHCEPEGWILLTEQGIKSSPGRVRSLNVRNFTRWTFQDIEDPVSAFPFASGAINVVSAKSELLRLNSRGRCTHRSPIKFESDSDKPSRLTFGESPHHVTGFDNTYTGGNLCSVDLRTPQETRYLGLLNVSNKELHLEVLSSSYLVVSDNGCVALYDAIDGFRWRTLMPGAVQASRLASGNFLICGQGRVTEVSKEGFVVWERFLATQPERFQLCSPLLGLAFSLPSEEQRTRAPSIRLESYQNEDARLPIAKYLAKYAVSLPEGVERLRGLLKDQRQEVQDVARAGLVAYDANPLIQTIKRIRTDRDVSKRCDLIMEGFRGASNDRLWAPVFLEALKDPHEEVRWYGANGAGCCDLEADILVPVLIKSVQKEGAKIRNMAIMSLGRMGRKGQQAIPLLIEVAQGNDEDSSYFAAFSLGRIGDDPRILPVLVELLRSKDSRRRRGALEGIWSLKPNSQEVYARLKDALKACRKQPASKSTNDEQKQIESVIQRLAMPDRGD